MSLKKKKKRSSKDFFMEIWEEREHFSEVSGEPLGSMIPHAYFFSHILSKGAHPALKFHKRNIMLMTLDEHTTWEFDVPDKGDIWDKVYERKQEMLELEKEIKNNPCFLSENE